MVSRCTTQDRSRNLPKTSDEPQARWSSSARAAEQILLIEDTAAIRYYVRSILESLGYDAVEACDGRDGLECYRQFPVAIVITDLKMPGIDGFDVIRELRHDFPDVNIIAMSGDPQLLHRAQQLGAQHTIEKPFDPEALSQAIHDCQYGRLGDQSL